jgi:alpha-beta hydrolase superfamily lysophospholipase
MKVEHIEPSKLDRPEILSTIFFPRRDESTAAPPLAKDFLIDVSENGTALSCRFHACDKDAPVILYFHGNGEIVSDYDTVASEYTAAGINIFFATYRGYGSSSGSPSVSALFHDNIRISGYMQEYLRENGYSGALFAMGRSLGSASVIDLVSRYPDDFKGLILDSAFADTLPLAKRLGYDISNHDITEEDCFNNLAKIRKITNPTLIFHGARDQMIPVAEAEKLQAESGAKTKQFHIVPGADHNTIISIGGALYFETIKNFIDTVTGKNTWRQRRRSNKKKRDS